MIVQACLNGARPAGYHPDLPLTVDQMAQSGAACVAAGAAELHIHARDRFGRESLSAVDDLISAMRRMCPGTLVGVSTGAWIERDIARTRECIAGWSTLPDYASVNLSEEDAPALISLLQEIGVGVEAGLATVADAQRLVGLPGSKRAFRVLIEVGEQNLPEADSIVSGIAETLNEARLLRPILLHGFEETMWHFVRRARQESWSTRVWLEDGCRWPDGSPAAGNAALVAEAMKIYQRRLG